MKKLIQTILNVLLISLLVIFVISCAGSPAAVDENVGLGDSKDSGSDSAVAAPDTKAADSEVVVPSESDAVKTKKAEIAGAPSETADEGSVSTELALPSGYSSALPEEKSLPDGEPAPVSMSPVPGSSPSASGLKAGYSDDNRQFNYFLSFLDEYKDVPHIGLDIAERIIFYVKDMNGRTLPNAEIEIISEGSTVVRGTTLADGSFRFFPSLYGNSLREYEIRVIDPLSGKKTGDQFSRNGRREIDLTVQTERVPKEKIPLDILFILDTTGSMGEEIQRLKATIELIHLNLSSLPSKPALRFGLVLYKDAGDEEYRTQIVPLTENLEKFQEELNLVEAYGGGDTPEDLQAALSDSLKVIKWNRDGIRLAFIITDAPPHLDYEQEFDYTLAAQEAKERGIKIHSVGTGGLPLEGEYVLRQISQFTTGRYIFLTYGESGESEGGAPGSVSHHTGANFQTDKLEAIIIRFAKEELGYLSDKPLEKEDPYFEANLTDSEKKEDTLETLFGMAMEQLRDYSSYSVDKNTRAAVVPFDFNQGDLALDAEYFTERLIISFKAADIFTLVERKDIQKILEEQNLQLSGITEGENASRLGKILNADVLITGNLFRKDTHFELFLRLVRVETGEILSVTRSVIDRKLGIR